LLEVNVIHSYPGGSSVTISKRSIAASLALTLSLAGSSIAVRGTADAAGTVRSNAAQSPPHRGPALVVNVHVRKHHITRSRSGFRPGNTVFNLYFSAARGHAALQLLRLRQGYTFKEFRADVASEALSAIRRIDRKAIFYGGMPVSHRTASHFGARLDRGKYWLFDFDTPRWVSLRVEGARQRRSLPPTTGSVNMVMRKDKHRFRTPRHLPRSGWLRQSNRTDEPHFMDMTNVKRSTTRQQVRRAFNGHGGSGWAIRDYPGTFLVSPGHTVVWRYAYPRGKYLELCFWPSDEDGTPHAQMGMWNFITLR
jgi:hypothetical protein